MHDISGHKSVETWTLPLIPSSSFEYSPFSDEF